MPSDQKQAQVFEALARPLDTFRSALASTIESLRGRMDDAAAEADPSTRTPGEDLGSFAAGRIDLDRFGAVAARETVAVEAGSADRVREAFEALQGLAERHEGLFRTQVPSGGSLRDTVAAALADVGRAFGAARAVGVAVGNDGQAGAAAPFGFAQWSSAERAIAPPLLVEVDGADCRAEALAEFLDGSLKIVLQIEGDAPPAPLARLITPGVYVAQVRTARDLGRFADWDGPGIAALVPQGAVAFVHDPDAGPTSADRLTLEDLPETWPSRSVAGFSPFQQGEPLRHLKALATAAVQTAAADDAGVPPAPADPVDKLAAWLLSQSDLSNLEG